MVEVYAEAESSEAMLKLAQEPARFTYCLFANGIESYMMFSDIYILHHRIMLL